MNRRMLIAAIVIGLVLFAACALIMNPGPFGFG